MMPKDDPTDLNVKRKFDSGSTIVETGQGKGYKRIKLHVDIPVDIPADNPTPETDESFSSLSPDSLFDEPLQFAIPPNLCQPALRTPPPIPGLFFDPSVLLPEEMADELSKFCLERYFDRRSSLDDEMSSGINQVMLFGRARDVHDSKDTDNASGDATEFNSASNPTPSSGLSPPLVALLNTLSRLLSPPVLPQETHDLLFESSSMSSRPEHSSHPITQTKQAQARQAILNLYAPGEGISSHVDLLRRFGDGIIGVSLCGGCVMRFERVRESDEDDDRESIYDVYLPPNSIIVLSGDARYKWTHGIERRTGDWVEPYGNSSVTKEKAEWIPRGMRLSITFRWLLPGADVVGDD